MKTLYQKIRTNFKRRNVIHLLIMTVCFAIGCGVCYVNEIEPRKHDVYTVDPIEETEETDLYPLTEGETITQDFVYTNNQMIAIGPMLYSDMYFSFWQASYCLNRLGHSISKEDRCG